MTPWYTASIFYEFFSKITVRNESFPRNFSRIWEKLFSNWRSTSMGLFLKLTSHAYKTIGWISSFLWLYLRISFSEIPQGQISCHYLDQGKESVGKIYNPHGFLRIGLLVYGHILIHFYGLDQLNPYLAQTTILLSW